jgi:LuxR family maltose regulon positive regulatory protein
MKSGLPALPPRHVSRRRLTQRLDEVAARTVVVFGPAGFGKTTLAAEWARDREGVACFRVTAASADLAGFALGVGEAVASVAPFPVECGTMQSPFGSTSQTASLTGGGSSG